jgi:hypothetical protein
LIQVKATQISVGFRLMATVALTRPNKPGRVMPAHWGEAGAG